MKSQTARVIDQVAHFSDEFTSSDIDAFLNLLRELVCVIDQDGRLLRLNMAAQQALGIQASHIRSERFFSFLDVDAVRIVREELRQTLVDPNPVRFTASFRIKPDQLSWIEWTIVRSQNRTNFIAVGTDISEQVRSTGQQKTRNQAQTQLSTLSPREHEVLGLVVAGNANKVIARRLDLSEKTVERHRSNGMKKLGISTVPDLVRLMMTAIA